MCSDLASLVPAGWAGRTSARCPTASVFALLPWWNHRRPRARPLEADVAVYPDVCRACCVPVGSTACWSRHPARCICHLVTQLAAAGVPILCEKPCGISAPEAREAAAIAQRHGVKLQVAYWRRFVPSLQRLRQRIVAGDMGALYFVACYQWDGEPPRCGVPHQQRRHLHRHGRA